MIGCIFSHSCDRYRSSEASHSLHRPAKGTRDDARPSYPHQVQDPQASAWAALVAVASPPAAQTAGSGKWEIEFTAGVCRPRSSSGTVSLPGPGQSSRRLASLQSSASRRFVLTARIVLVFRRWGAVVQSDRLDACRQARRKAFSGRITRSIPSSECRSVRSAGGSRRGTGQPRLDAATQRGTERRLQSGATADHAGQQRRDRSDACEFHRGLYGLIGLPDSRAEEPDLNGGGRRRRWPSVLHERSAHHQSEDDRGTSFPMRPSVRA